MDHLNFETAGRAALALQEINTSLSLSRELSVRLASMAAKAQATRDLLEAAIEASGGPSRGQRRRPASPSRDAPSPRSAQRRCLTGPASVLLPDSLAADACPGEAWGGSTDINSSPPPPDLPNTAAVQTTAHACSAALQDAPCGPLLPPLREQGSVSSFCQQASAPLGRTQPVGGGSGGNLARLPSPHGPLLAGPAYSAPCTALVPSAALLGTLSTSLKAQPAATTAQYAASTAAPAAAPAASAGMVALPAARLVQPLHFDADFGAEMAVHAGHLPAQLGQPPTPVGSGLRCFPNQRHQPHQLQPQAQQQPRQHAPDVLRRSDPARTTSDPAGFAGLVAAPPPCGGCGLAGPRGGVGGAGVPELSATVAAAAAFLSGSSSGAPSPAPLPLRPSPSPPSAPSTPRRAQSSKARGRASKPDAVAAVDRTSSAAAACSPFCSSTVTVPAFVAASAAAWRISFKSLSPTLSGSDAAEAAPPPGSVGGGAAASGGGGHVSSDGCGERGATAAPPPPESWPTNGFLGAPSCWSIGATAAPPLPLSRPSTSPLPCCQLPVHLLPELQPLSLPPRLPYSRSSSATGIPVAGQGGGLGATGGGDRGGGSGDTPDSLAEPAPPAQLNCGAGAGAWGTVPPPAVVRDLGAVLAARF